MYKFFSLFQICNALNFIVQFKREPVYDIQTFFVNEYSSITYEYSVSGIKGVFYEYPYFPYHLEEYSFVDFIEEDTEVSINKNRYINFNFEENLVGYFLQTNPIWNLDRLDQNNNLLNNKYYFYSTGGKDVNVYIVDTGVEITHPEFGGRATWGANLADNINTDCNGHGTHVAGSVGSKTYGVAKMANLIAVKVLDCKGSGSNSGVIKGLEYISQRFNNGKPPTVINMSLGGPKSNILNSILAKMVNSGIHIVAAAGNENQDACNTSPASEPSVITVGAFSPMFHQSSFSNWGVCVNILAPGESIKSTYIQGTTKLLAGTSMASPQIAGIVALTLGENKNINPNELKKLLLNKCNKINTVKNSTPNCVGYSLSLV